MMIVPAGVKVHLALGYSDMRKGLDGLAALVQETLKQDPVSGHLFAFRGKSASMLKILFLVWRRTVLVHEENRPRRVHLAAHHGARQHHHLERGTTRDADRGH